MKQNKNIRVYYKSVFAIVLTFTTLLRLGQNTEMKFKLNLIIRSRSSDTNMNTDKTFADTKTYGSTCRNTTIETKIKPDNNNKANNGIKTQ